MTELQWLIKMLTTKKLSPALKDDFILRIGEVEEQLTHIPKQALFLPRSTAQAPSMQRILDEAANEPGQPIVNSPVAAQALAERQRAIAVAMSDKPEPGRTSPRKF